jgi:hypothetical protein
LTTEKIMYIALPLPLTTVGRHNIGECNFKGLFETKDMLIKISFKASDNPYFMSMPTVYTLVQTLRYYKNDLPKSKLMGMLEDTDIYFGGKTLEKGTILHFSDCLVIYS